MAGDAVSSEQSWCLPCDVKGNEPRCWNCGRGWTPPFLWPAERTESATPLQVVTSHASVPAASAI